MSDPVIKDVRLALIEAPLREPIVAPFGTLTVRRNLLVLVELAGGGIGIGEVWANFPPWGCQERIEILRNVVRPLLRGETLDDPRRLYQILRARMRSLANQLGAAGPFHQAAAGADIALWDARARWMDMPLADLLRGACGAARAPVYATNLPSRRPEMVEAMAAKGHTRFKFRMPAVEADLLRALTEFRAAAGDRALMTDAAQGYDPESLAKSLPALDQVGLRWLEEPFPVDDVAAYLRWKKQGSRTPIAMGENSYGLDGFDRLLSEIAPDIIQPDITKTGGISQGAEICRRMQASGRTVCLHMYGGPVGLYASAHLAASLEEAPWVEMDSKPNPLFERILKAEPKIAAGELALPPGPGIGDVFDENALRAADVTGL